MEYYKIHKVFLDFCNKYYGYRDSEPSVQSLFITMVVTYIDTINRRNIAKRMERLCF